eukprot:Skav231795  [mRNA]  locus=scaffold734:107780:108757:+ [translate_table: standard]
MSPSRPADHYRALVGAGAVSAALKFGKWGTSLGTSSASSASSFPSSSSHRRMRMSRVRQGPRTALQAQTAYRWEQGDAVDQELRIMLPVPQSTTAKDIDFKVCERFIRVGLKNLMDQVLLEGELWSSVDVEDTYFELEDSEDSEDSESGRFLKVYLAKCHVETWEEVLKPCWTWEPAGRHNEEIRIHVPVGNDVKASDLDFRLSYGRIRLACNDKPLLEGDLWGQVDPTDCDWMIENHKGQRCVVVSLGKLHVRENWDRLLKTEEGKGGWETFQPGSRKDVDMAVLGSLEYVNTLLHQKDVEYAKEYLDHILPPEQEAEKTGEQR